MAGAQFHVAHSYEFGAETRDTKQLVQFTLSTSRVVGPAAIVQRIRDNYGAYEEAGRWKVECEKRESGASLTFTGDAGAIELSANVLVVQDDKVRI